ncbi:3-hydroxyacyl-[acyl-carrier-protein] dehydratase FERN, mitochondrial-like isoform X2 [Actinidia eriantha]|uniref:3-hydroxyacyl-[acyl-carrier-protein] dehydratase FERN, mitochondrial-like isoform X2 n=1 Tax=Actinidia eriantha TaxID=165200 RepID=UPI0025895DF1|nr:3-hydroxyacyl-[acyl-carrier-protein] dehydratase FERN, mitochondrial-like isoform X2 [Actinidia eriantha]
MKHNTTWYNPAKMLTKCIVSSFYPSLRFSSLSASTIKTGDILKQARIFSSSDVLEYSKLSHDSNPLHFDIECAQNAGFEDRLVPGMLVASLFPRIIASHFPGAIYVSQSLQFRSPVYIGEEIIGEVEATNIRAIKNNAKFKTKCFKQGDHVVMDGEATAILPTLAVEQGQSMG